MPGWATQMKELGEQARAMMSAGQGDAAIDLLLGLATSIHTDNTRMAVRVERLTRLLFGRRTERLSRDELRQLTLAFGGSEAEANEAEPKVPASPPPTETSDAPVSTPPSKRRPNHRGRTKLSEDLEREVVEVPVPPAERACAQCGEPMATIGHLEHERVEYVPAKIVVHVERREKLGCKACRGDAVTAERETSPCWTRRAGPSLLAHLIESKCDDALPVERQRRQLARLGFEVPQNTLYGYWDHATELLGPVASVVCSRVLGEDIVGIDDTKLDFLDRAAPGGKRRGHLWCFIGQSPLLAFAFTESWKAEEIAPWMMAAEGFIQCDDYGGYAKQIEWPDGSTGPLVPSERRLGCMMHVRRRFHDALKARDRRAAVPLAKIAALYEVEARAKGLSPPERLALRQRESIPLLDAFDAWVDDHKPKLLPTSPLGRATHYAHQQRPYVRRCFTDGRFEIDNGRVERAIRAPAIGRKNYLFSGSARGAQRLADAYTLVQSGRRVGLPVRDYLTDILTKLEAGFPMRRIDELTPDRWAAAHGIPAPDQPLQ